MSLERIKIRNTLVTLLKGATDAEDDVFSSRAIPVLEESLPAINIYTKSESISKFADAPKSYIRNLTVSVEVLVKDDDDSKANDLADIICSQVEKIIDQEDQNSKGRLGCLIESAELDGIDIEWENDGDNIVCSARMTYNIKYVRDAALVTSNTTELERVNTDWDVGSANDPDPEATDLIELRA